MKQIVPWNHLVKNRVKFDVYMSSMLSSYAFHWIYSWIFWIQYVSLGIHGQLSPSDRHTCVPTRQRGAYQFRKTGCMRFPCIARSRHIAALQMRVRSARPIQPSTKTITLPCIGFQKIHPASHACHHMTKSSQSCRRNTIPTDTFTHKTSTAFTANIKPKTPSQRLAHVRTKSPWPFAKTSICRQTFQTK